MQLQDNGSTLPYIEEVSITVLPTEGCCIFLTGTAITVVESWLGLQPLSNPVMPHKDAAFLGPYLCRTSRGDSSSV